jgi:hypothetical protein
MDFGLASIGILLRILVYSRERSRSDAANDDRIDLLAP